MGGRRPARGDVRCGQLKLVGTDLGCFATKSGHSNGLLIRKPTFSFDGIAECAPSLEFGIR
jgi:hypothetical protein